MRSTELYMNFVLESEESLISIDIPYLVFEGGLLCAENQSI